MMQDSDDDAMEVDPPAAARESSCSLALRRRHKPPANHSLPLFSQKNHHFDLQTRVETNYKNRGEASTQDRASEESQLVLQKGLTAANTTASSLVPALCLLGRRLALRNRPAFLEQ
jgi:hypothetical protein